jgi:Rod binding domain-containing protein
VSPLQIPLDGPWTGDALALLGAARPTQAGQPPPPRRDDALARACKDFESVLVHKLLGEMKRTIPDSGLLDSPASKQVEGIFWYHLSQDVARRGGLGLWQELYRQFGGRTDNTPDAPTVEQTR